MSLVDLVGWATLVLGWCSICAVVVVLVRAAKLAIADRRRDRIVNELIGVRAGTGVREEVATGSVGNDRRANRLGAAVDDTLRVQRRTIAEVDRTGALAPLDLDATGVPRDAAHNLVVVGEQEESNASQSPLYRLSPRQSQVLRLMVEGLTNQQIAEQLAVSPGTVKGHLMTIRTKFGTRSTRAVIARAITEGLLDAPERIHDAPA